MAIISIGIGEIAVSENPKDVLLAPNLGSCLALAVYDRVRRRGGMVHCLLPLSHRNPMKAKSEPASFVDTGVALLLNQMLESGASKKELTIIAAGCSNINDPNDFFAIGRNNHAVLRKILWKNSLLIHGEHIGGEHPRSLKLLIGTGEVLVKVNGTEERLSKGDAHVSKDISC